MYVDGLPWCNRRLGGAIATAGAAKPKVTRATSTSIYGDKHALKDVNARHSRSAR